MRINNDSKKKYTIKDIFLILRFLEGVGEGFPVVIAIIVRKRRREGGSKRRGRRRSKCGCGRGRGRNNRGNIFNRKVVVHDDEGDEVGDDGDGGRTTNFVGEDVSESEKRGAIFKEGGLAGVEVPNFTVGVADTVASDVAEGAVNGFKMSFAEVAIESFARALADSAASAVDVVVDVVREA